jgi:hypothetical protein
MTSLIPYVPPPPENPILKFKKLVEAFDNHREQSAEFEREFERRNAPVPELIGADDPHEYKPSDWEWLESEAKNLLEKTQAFWPEENIHYHASFDYINERLCRTKETLKGDLSEAGAISLINRIEAELPSVMALETTFQQFEDNEKKFPLQSEILPVLQKQIKLWAKRMAAVDLARIEKFGIEWQAARQEQYAIFEKDLRAKLAFANHNDLLALLDVDKRVDECLHYVTAIAILRREKCNELADKLHRGLEKYQAAGEASWDVYYPVSQLYEEAVLAIREKRSERERQLAEERKRQQQAEKRLEIHRRFLEARQREHDRIEYDPWSELSAEQIAEIQTKGFPQKVTIRDLEYRIDEQDKLISELQQQITDLRTGG